MLCYCNIHFVLFSVPYLKNLPNGVEGLHPVPRKSLYVGTVKESVKILAGKEDKPGKTADKKKLEAHEIDTWNHFFNGCSHVNACDACAAFLKQLKENGANHKDSKELADVKRKKYTDNKKRHTQHLRTDIVNHPNIDVAQTPWPVHLFVNDNVVADDDDDAVMNED